MTKDDIREVKAVYSARNKIRHTKVAGINNKITATKPFFSGLIEKLDKNTKSKI